jgi:hypothetical protein
VDPEPAGDAAKDLQAGQAFAQGIAQQQQHGAGAADAKPVTDAGFRRQVTLITHLPAVNQRRRHDGCERKGGKLGGKPGRITRPLGWGAPWRGALSFARFGRCRFCAAGRGSCRLARSNGRSFRAPRHR